MYTYLNLTYLMGLFNQFNYNLKPVYMELVKHILRYVSKTLDLNLKFDGKADIPDDVIRYIDSDFAESKIDQKSTKDYIFMVIRAVISHSSKL